MRKMKPFLFLLLLSSFYAAVAFAQTGSIQDKNEKIKATNALITKCLNEGLKAYAEKNYELAISKFSEGIDADPDYTGSATVLNNNKAIALRMKAVNEYNQGTTDVNNRQSWRDKSENDLKTSLAASQRALELIAKEKDTTAQKKYSKEKHDALSNICEVQSLLLTTNADIAKPKEAVAALDAYLAVETDPALKIKSQVSVANALHLSGNTELAIPISRRILQADPNNVDATACLGLCLFELGLANNNKEQMKESLSLLKKFIAIAPDSHPLKSSVKEAVTYLESQ